MREGFVLKEFREDYLFGLLREQGWEQFQLAFGLIYVLGRGNLNCELLAFFREFFECSDAHYNFTKCML